MFSQTAEYALRAMACLAERAPAARTTEQIAQATCVPSAYLSKVLQALGRAKIVRSQRGIGGGIFLARDLEEITILDVINAVDPIRRITECPIGLAAHGVRLCPLHSRLDYALSLVESAFRETTLAEILVKQTSRGPGCQFPQTHRSEAAI